MHRIMHFLQEIEINRIATNIRNRSSTLELPEQIHSEVVVELSVDVVEDVLSVVVLVVVDAKVLEE